MRKPILRVPTREHYLAEKLSREIVFDYPSATVAMQVFKQRTYLKHLTRAILGAEREIEAFERRG